MLGGCGGGVTADQIAKIVAALSASAAFAGRMTKAGTSFSHYLERRVKYLTSKNSSWANENGFPSLSARIGAEMDALGAFIDTTAAALDPDTKAPAHRDLDDAAKRQVGDGPSVVSTNAARFHSDRKQRVAQIVWRAGAVQDGVWGGGDSTLAPALQKVPLLEFVDRRLRAVEIMMLHDGTGPGGWKIGAAASDWKDQQRTAMFEYPWVDEFDASRTPIFANALGAVGLTIPGLAPTWREEKAESRVYFAPHWTRWRDAAARDWTVSDSPYVLTYTGAGPLSAALEHVIPASPTMNADFEDFWQRSWMYCDMMLAFLHVEALRFARKRRTNSDTDFDAAAAGGVTLRPIIPRTVPPDPAWLMANGANWFDGAALEKDELQIGDHLILWNSAFVRNMLGSAFGLENSIVTRVMPDGYTLMLAGHGESEFAEAHFLDELASEIKSAFVAFRRKVEEGVSLGLGDSLHMKRMNIPFHIVRWAPFNETFKRSSSAPLPALQVDGAWWFRIRLAQLQDAGDPPITMNLALAHVPKSIRFVPGMQAPPLGPGDHDPDFQESIYLPLSVPHLSGGWATYLAAPNPGGTVFLDDLVPDGSMVPGFYSDGPATKIPVFRPKLKP